ncbi:hypothetical protein [Ruegeria halocynthiae]|uniref:hypothetical protein n=1 Tax=Ruegeria halocynthiae TaxID=985054 RepID=UPI000A9D5937|nr:hypothetical protein [Ruegeria halocynthiae]
MKTLIAATLLTATALSTPALAFSLSTQGLTRNLSFPEPVSEPVTQDTTNPGK